MFLCSQIVAEIKLFSSADVGRCSSATGERRRMTEEEEEEEEETFQLYNSESFVEDDRAQH